MFVLIVDSFEIKYVGCCHSKYLLHALHRGYTVKCDWEGTTFSSINLAWDYTK